MKEFHILNLGAGVQSTALYLMSLRKEFGIPWFDAAIFADTGEEPQDVYEHVEWLKKQGGPEIMIRAVKHKLGDDLLAGGSLSRRNSKGFVTIPAFTVARDTGKAGLMRRQCTKEYKTEVIERCVKQEIFGLKPKERNGGRFFNHTYLGLSAEESRRVKNNLAVFEKMKKWQKAHFPLWAMGWHRQMIKAWLKDKVPHEVPRSACTFCPFHDNAEWQRVKASPVDWERACRIDDALRAGGFAAKQVRGEVFVHNSCVPLREADLSTDESETHELSFSGVAATDCTGFCGH
jgi:hypothetical protein